MVDSVSKALPTKEGWRYLKGASDEGVDHNTLMSRHLSPEEFHEKFYESGLGQIILEDLETPEKEPDTLVKTLSKGRYRNSWFESLNLLVQRELLLWWRDKYQIKAKIGQSKQICFLKNPTNCSFLTSAFTYFPQL